MSQIICTNSVIQSQNVNLVLIDHLSEVKHMKPEDYEKGDRFYNALSEYCKMEPILTKRALERLNK